MSGLARELAARGHAVSGVDHRRYEPAATLLEAAGVRLLAVEDVLPPVTERVLVSGGGEVEHPHRREAAARGVPVESFAAFLGRSFLANSRNVVVAGTNGKTTTTAMLVWLLEALGHAPDYLVGGDVPGLANNVRLAGAGIAVLEGDEYPADAVGGEPKFRAYRAEVVAVTNVHFDHPEVYADAVAYEAAFHGLAATLPPNGCAVYNADDPVATRVAAGAPTRLGVGFGADAELVLTEMKVGPEGTRFRCGGVPVALPACAGGRLNARNAGVALALASRLGVPVAEGASALADFPGVAERQEVVSDGAGGTLVVDDAYHPEALRALFAALGARFPGRALVPVFRARYHGGVHGYQQRYLPAAFAGIDRAVVCNAVRTDPNLPETDDFDNARFRNELEAGGCRVFPAAGIDAVLPATAEAARAGDVLVCLFGFGKPNLREGLKAVLRKLEPSA